MQNPEINIIKLNLEGIDYELEACKAKMSRSLINTAGHYIFGRAPAFFHLDYHGKIHVVLPIKGKDEKHAKSNRRKN